MNKIKTILPGIIICSLVGILSKWLGGIYSTVGAASFAIFIGILLGNTFFKDKKYNDGTKFAEKDLLNYSIVLMGANLNLNEILSLGFNGLIFVILQMILTMLVAYWIGKRLHFNKEYCLLMASGNAVCGSSAIGATAPIINAKDSDKVISITIVNVVGTILMILLPTITLILYNNETLKTSAMIGGVLQSVGQVIGSANFISEDVVKLATVFKIIRIIMLIGVVIIYERINLNNANNENKNIEENSIKYKRKFNIPWFIKGFFIICVLYTIGLVPQSISKIFKWISGNFEIIALAGIGMRVKISDLKKKGPKSICYGGVIGVSQIIFAIILISIFFK